MSLIKLGMLLQGYTYVCTFFKIDYFLLCTIIFRLWDSRTKDEVNNIKMSDKVTSIDLSWDETKLVVTCGLTVNIVDVTRYVWLHFPRHIQLQIRISSNCIKVIF